MLALPCHKSPKVSPEKHRTWAVTSSAANRRITGHTIAVYVEIAGKTLLKPEAAKELIADMNEIMLRIREKASFTDDKLADEILDVYREGIASLRR